MSFSWMNYTYAIKMPCTVLKYAIILYKIHICRPKTQNLNDVILLYETHICHKKSLHPVWWRHSIWIKKDGLDLKGHGKLCTLLWLEMCDLYPWRKPGYVSHTLEKHLCRTWQPVTYADSRDWTQDTVMESQCSCQLTGQPNDTLKIFGLFLMFYFTNFATLLFHYTAEIFSRTIYLISLSFSLGRVHHTKPCRF